MHGPDGQGAGRKARDRMQFRHGRRLRRAPPAGILLRAWSGHRAVSRFSSLQAGPDGESGTGCSTEPQGFRSEFQAESKYGCIKTGGGREATLLPPFFCVFGPLVGWQAAVRALRGAGEHRDWLETGQTGAADWDSD